jgi:predicted GNAT family acetyltransferase
MQAHATKDVEEYAAAVVGFLEAEPCARNVLRTVIDLVRLGHATTDAPSFWWVEDGGQVVGAAHLTPPFPLLVSSLPPEAAAPLADSVRGRTAAVSAPVPGVNGPRESALAVASAWTAATGTPHRVYRRLLLHELEAVADVARPSGRRRPAAREDLEIVARWIQDFAVETELLETTGHQRTAALMIERGEIDLWVSDGTPVSLAGHRTPAAAVVRIGPVYTPPEHRSHGYARRLVAETSVTALRRHDVRYCMLYTDMANPVSNSIYRQIGYVPKGEHVEIAFG